MKKKWISLTLCLILSAGMLEKPLSIGKAAAEAAEAAEEMRTSESIESVIDPAAYDSNEVIVVYKDSGSLYRLSQTKKAIARELPEGVEEEALTEDSSLLTVDSKEQLEDAIETLSKEEEVAYIQPNYTYRLAELKDIPEADSLTDDAYGNYQWMYNGVYNIQMKEAWDLGVGANQEVIVAVMDTGVNYEHQDLEDAMWINEDEIEGNGKDDDGNGYVDDIYGWNCSENSNEVCAQNMAAGSYTDNHGTHIAGVIAATADNSYGIAGIASKNNVKIMSVKIFPDQGEARTTDIIRGISYAKKNKATICNMSFVTDYYDAFVKDAMEDSDILFVCAAGNGERWSGYRGYNIETYKTYPADFKLSNMITVANMNATGVIDKSSCYGREMVDLAAPGTDIFSTIVAEEKGSTGAYDCYTGTSMATPMVTGAAALTASYYGGLNISQIKQAILNGAVENTKFSGRVNSDRMLSVYGALSYYQDKMVATAKVSKISKSNYKKVTVSVVSLSSKITDAAYVYGTYTAEDFPMESSKALSLGSGNEGAFTANKSGVYTIYLKNEAGESVVKKVNVTIPALSALTLSSHAKVLKVGKTYKLKATVAPSAVYSKITYKSSKKSVAVVNSSGKITAKKAGTATITVKATDGAKTITKKCRITVKKN